MNSTINVKLPRLVKDIIRCSIRRNSADRYAYENISSVYTITLCIHSISYISVTRLREVLADFTIFQQYRERRWGLKISCGMIYKRMFIIIIISHAIDMCRSLMCLLLLSIQKFVYICTDIMQHHYCHNLCVWIILEHHYETIYCWYLP